MIWLEEYHINKYVKKYDARAEGRYLNPPKIRSDFQIGDLVVIIPQGRFGAAVPRKDVGKLARITSFTDNRHKLSGRGVSLELLNGKKVPFTIREINLKLKAKSLDKPE